MSESDSSKRFDRASQVTQSQGKLAVSREFVNADKAVVGDKLLDQQFRHREFNQRARVVVAVIIVLVIFVWLWRVHALVTMLLEPFAYFSPAAGEWVVVALVSSTAVVILVLFGVVARLLRSEDEAKKGDEGERNLVVRVVREIGRGGGGGGSSA